MPLRPSKQTTSVGPPGIPLTTSDTPPNGSFVSSDTSASVSLPVASDGLPVARLKHYRLLELIGRGGMGDVYRAHDEMFDRIAAVKVLPPDLAQDETFVCRFQREAKAIAGLSHPHIVPVYDIDEDQGYSFFAMQFVEGESLDRRLRRVQKLSLFEALRIIVDCLSALQFAHDKGLIHRDVKPGNVLLQAGTDHVFVVDFGLVRRIEDQSLLTVTGMVMGTVDYMAPEQARGAKQIGAHADLYSVGAMFYQLLAGQLPFSSQSFTSMLYSHAYERPTPLDQIVPELPQEIVALVHQLLEKDPQKRPASCRVVLDALEPFQSLEFRSRQIAAEVEREITAKAPESSIAMAQLPQCDAWWQRWRDQVVTACRLDSPAWLGEMRSLAKQLQGALLQKQQRHAHLLVLREEGCQLLDELTNAPDVTSLTDNHSEQAESLVQQLADLEQLIAVCAEEQRTLARRRDALDTRLARFGQQSPRFNPYVVLSVVAVFVGAIVIKVRMPPQSLPSSFDERTPADEVAGKPSAPEKLTPAVAPFDAVTARRLQMAWAKDLGVDPEKVVVLASGIELPLVLIPPGKFTKGSTTQERDRFYRLAQHANDQRALDEINVESALQAVEIPRAFFIGRCEFTQAQWQALMGDNPSKFPQGGTYPVEQVSWNDVQALLAKLNRDHKVTGMRYVLPSEDQWEYACRAGTEEPWFWGTSAESSKDYAWCNGLAESATHPTAQRLPNAWGLHDMAGNVWEWCDNVVEMAPGGSGILGRANRGGACNRPAYRCRSAHRGYWPQEAKHTRLGFRVALVFEENTDNSSLAESLEPAQGSKEILPLLRLPDDVVTGNWQAMADGTLLGGQGRGHDGHARVQLAVMPRGDYDLAVQFARAGDGDINVLFPLGSGNARANFGHFLGITVGPQGDSSISKAPMGLSLPGHTSQRHEALIKVRTRGEQASVTITLDGKPIVDWQGDPRELAVNPPCQITDPRAIGLSTHSDGARFHQVRLTMHSGSADLRRAEVVPARRPTETPISEGMRLAMASEVAWPKEKIDALVEVNPGDVSALLKRCHWHAVRYRWQDARKDLERIVELQPDELHLRADLAAICIYLEDSQSFADQGDILHRRLAGEGRPWKVYAAARSILLSDAERFDFPMVRDEVTRRLKPDENVTHKRFVPISHYRCGDYQKCADEAAKLLPKGPNSLWDSLLWLYRAMALQRLNRSDEAKASLAAIKSIAERERGPYWTAKPGGFHYYFFDAIHVQVVYREASKLILGQRQELTLIPITFPNAQAEVVALQGQSAVYGPLKDLNARIAADPNNGKQYYQRYLWYAARQQWKEALVDAEKCLVLEPRWYNRTDLARLYLNLGDRDRYEQLCRELLQDIDKEPTVQAKCGSFRPLYLEPVRWQKEIEAFAPIAEAMHAKEPQHDEVRRTIIATRYRQGRWKECIDAADLMQPTGPKNMNDCYPWLFRIMAMHQLGQTAEAKTALQEWKAFIEEQTAAAFSGSNWEMHPVDKRLQWFLHNGREAQILYREASELILGKREELRLQPVVTPSTGSGGDTQSAVDALRLELAGELGWPIERINALVEANPNKISALQQRYYWNVIRLRWPEARADLDRIIPMQPTQPTDLYLRSDLAAICLFLGDSEAHAAHCEVLENRLSEEPVDWKIYFAAMSLSLSDAEEIDHPKVRMIATRRLMRLDRDLRRYLPLAHYRCGEWQACLEAADTYAPKGPVKMSDTVPWLFRVMALYRLEQVDEARASLAEVKKFAEAQRGPYAWRKQHFESLFIEALYSQIVYREASELILGQREELQIAPVNFSNAQAETGKL